MNKIQSRVQQDRKKSNEMKCFPAGEEIYLKRLENPGEKATKAGFLRRKAKSCLPGKR
jgi:hypothetical protein